MDIASRLSDGNRLSVSGVADVVTYALDNKSSIGILIDLLRTDDPSLRMRAADALEKISTQKPTLLAPLETRIEILDIYTTEGQNDVRWNLIQILPRLGFCDMALPGITDRLLNDVKFHPSSLVRVAAMQALYDIASQNDQFRSKADEALREGMSGSPAMQSRARKLLSKS